MKIVAQAEELGLKLVIDPHALPASSKNTTSSPDDRFWYEHDAQNKYIYLWDILSKKLSQKGEVIAGYDLVNEPTTKRSFFNGHPIQNDLNWNNLILKLIKTIRRNDTKHTIIVEPILSLMNFGKRKYPLDGINYIKIPNDNNIVISPHFYEPLDFTHQNINGRDIKYKYPGYIDGIYWDKQKLKETLSPFIKFQNKHSIPIYIGEFSAVRWSNGGDLYIKDLIEIFEQYEWSWTYHIFRGSDYWDPEKTNDVNSKIRSLNNKRMNILKKYFTN